MYLDIEMDVTYKLLLDSMVLKLNVVPASVTPPLSQPLSLFRL